MTTRGPADAKPSRHYTVQRRLEPFGKFSLLEVQIDTGRTHQIRVHLASLGHPVVGDTLYGALARAEQQGSGRSLSLPRNFLHCGGLAISAPPDWRAAIFFGAFARRIGRFSAKLGG